MLLNLHLVFIFCLVVVVRTAPEGGATTEAPEVVVAKGRALQRVMMASLRQPESVARLGEVLPLLRSLTRTQRVGLAEMLQQAPLVVSGLTQQESVAAQNATLGRLLPQLDVVSLLRRGDEEAQREADEVQRARALEIVESAVAASPSVEFNSTHDEEGAELPEALELQGRRLHPSELLILLSDQRRSGSYLSRQRLPPGALSPYRQPPRLPTREQHGVNVALRPPLPPDDVAGQCELVSNSLCLDVPDYPREAILASMRRSPSAVLAVLASETDLEAGSERRQDTLDDNLVEEAPASALCKTLVKFAKPKRARNTQGHWKFLVNTGEEHAQTVRIELCNEPGLSCSFLQSGMTSQCVQIFSHHRLMAWDKERGLHLDIFKVPTCCSCHIQPAFGPAVFPSSVTPRPFMPPPLDAEPEFYDEETAAQETSATSRPPPSGWERPKRRRPVNPVTTTMRPGKPTFAIPPKVPFSPPAPVHETTPKTSTYPPIFNRDVRKRTTTRNKNREDLEDSGATIAQRRRRPVAISSDKIRGGGGSATAGGVGEDGSRINYNYHPIIDFFRNEQKQHQGQFQAPAANRRTSGSTSFDDDWRPMAPSHMAPNHRQ